jgi:hypothetical protein
MLGSFCILFMWSEQQQKYYSGETNTYWVCIVMAK